MRRLLSCLDLLRDRPGISTSEGQATLHNSTDWRSRMHDLKHDYGILVTDYRTPGRPDKCWKLGESYATARKKLHPSTKDLARFLRTNKIPEVPAGCPSMTMDELAEAVRHWRQDRPQASQGGQGAQNSPQEGEKWPLPSPRRPQRSFNAL